MLEYFDLQIDDPMSIEFTIDRFRAMLDQFGRTFDREYTRSDREM